MPLPCSDTVRKRENSKRKNVAWHLPNSVRKSPLGMVLPFTCDGASVAGDRGILGSFPAPRPLGK